MRKSTLLLVFLLFLGIQAVLAQRTISGVVTSSEDGTAIPGVTILVKEATRIGVLSDLNGKYTLKIPANAKTLVFSFIGYDKHEVPIGSNSVINVQLKTSSTTLDEVVVTAMGIKRSEKANGSSVTSVSGSDISKNRTSDIMTSLSGKIAGVQISNTSSDPGTSNSVVIRGFSSLSGSNQPLYIIDGVPMNNSAVFSSDGLNGGFDFGNGANAVNPDDVENMTILRVC
jgi:outer membrane receptor protein involved in Fe transport